MIRRRSGWCCCRSNFRPRISSAWSGSRHLRASATLDADARRIVGQWGRWRWRALRLRASRQHAGGKQRSGHARRAAGRHGPHCAGRRRVVALDGAALHCGRGLHRRHHGRACRCRRSDPVVLCGRNPTGGSRICRVARIMGGGSPAYRARRARRQQSAVPAGYDAVAGQHFLGAAGQPAVLLCRPGNDTRLYRLGVAAH